MKVGFASTHGGCLYYRAELPCRTLQAHGIDADVPGTYEHKTRGDLAVDPDSGAIGMPYDGEEWGEVPDVVFLAGAYPAIFGEEQIIAARRTGQIVIADLDDWPWTPPDNPTHDPTIGDRKIAALGAASWVTCSTPYLGAMLDEYLIRHTVCPNTIDPSRYAAERDANRWEDSVSTRLTIGYRGLLAGFHDEDVKILRGYLAPTAQYVHVGADPRSDHSFADLTGIPPQWVEDRQAVDFLEYGAQLVGVDVAVCPYARRPASQAKSPIAAFEWIAAGVPVAAVDHPQLPSIEAPSLPRFLKLMRQREERAALWEDQWADLEDYIVRQELDPPWLEALNLATAAHRS